MRKEPITRRNFLKCLTGIVATPLLGASCAPTRLKLLPVDSSRLEQRIRNESLAPQNNSPKKVALVLCSPHHEEDPLISRELGETYNFLIQRDYFPENIYFLSNTPEKIQDENGKPYFKNDGAPSKFVFKMLQEHLKEVVKPDDKFIAYIIAHQNKNGEIYPRPCYLTNNRESEILHTEDLEEFLNNVPTDFLLLNMCYAGKILKGLQGRLPTNNFPVTLCSSDKDHTSHKQRFPLDTPSFFTLFNSAYGNGDSPIQKAFEVAYEKLREDNPQIFYPEHIDPNFSL